MSENFVSDKPLENSAEDRFQRYAFSKRIAETIVKRDSKDGIVIGIYGAWGEGKTSILNFIEKELNDHTDILILKLNPWRYNDEDSLIKNYLRKIASVLGKKLDTNQEKFGSFVSKYGGIGSVFGADLTAVGKSLSDVDLEELKNRIDEFLRQSACKLVVFVDDIDRLDKQEIYALFRLIKLTADFSNTTYILSFDDKMVASAIGDRFGTINTNAGDSFLEKIIQVPLRIPQAQIEALKKFCFELVERAIKDSGIEFSKEDAQRFVSEFSANILLRLKTPRLAVRYSNTLSFSLPLLKGEVNHVDLMLVEALKIFYPRHYEFVKFNPHYFLSSYSSNSYEFAQGSKERGDDLSSHLDLLASDLTKREASAVRALLTALFPRMKEAFNNTFYQQGDRTWYKEKKIGSSHYFKRYFSYTVIEGDLSDTAFSDFIQSLKKSTIGETKQKIEEFIDDSSTDTFLEKLRSYEIDLDWESSQKIATSLALASDKFSASGSFLGFGTDSEKSQAAIFIYQLIKNRNNKEEGYRLAKTLMNAPIPFDFSFELNDWLRAGKQGEESLFTIEQYLELATTLKNRALEECNGEPLFDRYPKYAPFLFYTWQEQDPEAVERYLKDLLNKEVTNVKSLLLAFTPTATSSNYKDPYKSNFTQEQYRFLTRLIDKKFIHQKIQELFGEQIYTERVGFYDWENKQTDLNIARQFDHWYKLDVPKAPTS